MASGQILPRTNDLNVSFQNTRCSENQIGKFEPIIIKPKLKSEHKSIALSSKLFI